MRPELRNRLVLGFGIGGMVFAALILDMSRGSHQAVLILGLILTIAGCREFGRIASHTLAAEIQVLPMMVVGMLLILEAHLHRTPSLVPALADQPVVALLLAIGMCWVVIAHMFRHGTRHFFASVSITMFGMLYLGITLNLLERLALCGTPHNFSRGTQLLLLFLAATKMGDVAAYFGGRAFGRHKMAPGISPGKTWEGFAFSFLGSLGGVYLFNWILALCGSLQPFDHWWQLAVWAVVLGPFGVAGDLAESCMKREAAIKDSGSTLPGFGGFLDILDALILAAPIAYLLALYV